MVNDAPGDAVAAALRKYQGVVDLILDWTPSARERVLIEGTFIRYGLPDMRKEYADSPALPGNAWASPRQGVQAK
jgi:hypothetical protein